MEQTENSIYIPRNMVAALRSDHAGETGAVFIYRGILAISGDSRLRRFAVRHLETENRHLVLMEQLLPPSQRSRLLPIWRLAGWLTGALPSLFGTASVYRTIDAVESFVDRHYSRQIQELGDTKDHRPLVEILQACRDDELEHRDDARSRLGTAGTLGRAWSSVVAAGSSLGVYLASRF